MVYEKYVLDLGWHIQLFPACTAALPPSTAAKDKTSAAALVMLQSLATWLQVSLCSCLHMMLLRWISCRCVVLHVTGILCSAFLSQSEYRPARHVPCWPRHALSQHSTAQHSTAQHSTAQHSTAQHSTAQHSTAQHSTAQHSTAQHSTAQHSTCPTLPQQLT